MGNEEKDFQEEVLDETGENFTILNNTIVENGIDFKPIHKAVYMVFKRFAFYKEIKPSRERIAMMTGATKPTVDKAIKHLESKKVLRVERKRSTGDEKVKNEKNVYILLKIPDEIKRNATLCVRGKEFDTVLEERKKQQPAKEEKKGMTKKQWDELKDIYVETKQKFTEKDKKSWEEFYADSVGDTTVIEFVLSVHQKQREIVPAKKRLSFLKIYLYYIKQHAKPPLFDTLDVIVREMSANEPKTINKAILEAKRNHVELTEPTFEKLMKEARQISYQSKDFHINGHQGKQPTQLVSDYDDILQDVGDLFKN